MHKAVQYLIFSLKGRNPDYCKKIPITESKLTLKLGTLTKWIFVMVAILGRLFFWEESSPAGFVY